MNILLFILGILISCTIIDIILIEKSSVEYPSDKPFLRGDIQELQEVLEYKKTETKKLKKIKEQEKAQREREKPSIF